jgi:hypothetical protein
MPGVFEDGHERNGKPSPRWDATEVAHQVLPFDAISQGGEIFAALKALQTIQCQSGSDGGVVRCQGRKGSVVLFAGGWSFICSVVGASMLCRAIFGRSLYDYGIGYPLFGIIALVTGIATVSFVLTHQGWKSFLANEFDRKQLDLWRRHQENNFYYWIRLEQEANRRSNFVISHKVRRHPVANDFNGLKTRLRQ